MSLYNKKIILIAIVIAVPIIAYMIISNDYDMNIGAFYLASFVSKMAIVLADIALIVIIVLKENRES